MKIHCLGVNHNTAGVALRECLTFNPHQLNAALARLGCGQGAGWDAIRECVILSTCNRVEIYAVAEKPIFDVLAAFLAEIRSVPESEFEGATYRLLDAEASAHLLRVAAGLDSQVLGEPQILGQVAEAYSTARRHDTAGKILSRLFQTAIRAGKRTRTETKLGHNPGSIASVAVRLIARSIPDLRSARILVIGAGEMAELAVEAIRKRGATAFTVANRTEAGARALAGRWNGPAAALESLPELLVSADVVISSTGAPHTIISRDQIETALAKRPDRPLVLMDIAMPRDVEPGVDDLANVQRFDLDSLAAALETSLARREAEIPAVEAILAEEAAAFADYLVTLDVVPIIVAMRRQADAIREAELEKALRRMPELAPEDLEQLDRLTRSIVKKLLHQPTIHLRSVAGRSDAADYAGAARRLFGLD